MKLHACAYFLIAAAVLSLLNASSLYHALTALSGLLGRSL